jgi:DNA-directed RNA polymerase specialized sigma24 family protein
MVSLRLDRRLQGQIDPSDVLQKAFLDVYRRRAEYTQDPRMPPFLWLRFLTGQRLLALHRKHLGTQMREAELHADSQRMRGKLGGEGALWMTTRASHPLDSVAGEREDRLSAILDQYF